MKQVVATALVLLLTLFLLPLLLLGEEPLAGPSQPPAATGTLPIDRTVVTPRPDGGRPGTGAGGPGGTGRCCTLPLDKYLWRVVAAEMPASFEPEALKAQTVAARTYTLSKMERTVEAHPDADVCTDITCCQAYIDPADAAANWGENAQTYTDKIAAAVADTDGMAALFQGQPIQAVFFSSAAGRTVDAVEVWGNAVPYLTSVDSPEGDEVPNYHSTVTVPLGRVQKQAAGPVPAGRSVRRAGGLVCQPCPQFRRRGGDGGHRRHHRGRWKPAHPVRPALHQLHGLRLGGWGHLLRHRLRPRRGHEPVRRQRPGQGGEELRRDFEVVLHRHRRGPLYAPEVTGGPGGTHAAGAA